MSTHRPPPILISGSLGLDFLNTLATPVDTQIDWIDDGDGLLAWLEQARLVSAKDLNVLKARAMPGEFDAVAAQARSLRKWFRGFVKVWSGRSICPDDLANWSRSIASSSGTNSSRDSSPYPRKGCPSWG